MFDITTYEALLIGHILFAALWIGGDAMIQLFALRARKAGPERTLDFFEDVGWIGERFINAFALLVVIFGFGLVAEGSWDLGDPWLSAGLVAFLASGITGVAFLGPESKRIAKLAAERGADDADVQRRIGRIIVISRIELVVLILILYLMVTKPV